MIQINTTQDKKIITAGELVFKGQYLRCTQEKKKWYW